jgi:hypothetical protein
MQIAAFIVRGKFGNLFGDAFPHRAVPYFTDVPATDPAFPFIQKLRELGITAGCTATEFCGNQPLSREQLAVFIIRAFFN